MGVLRTPSMICKIVGQAFRPSKIDSRFRGNDRGEAGMTENDDKGNDLYVNNF